MHVDTAQCIMSKKEHDAFILRMIKASIIRPYKEKG